MLILLFVVLNCKKINFRPKEEKSLTLGVSAISAASKILNIVIEKSMNIINEKIEDFIKTKESNALRRDLLNAIFVDDERRAKGIIDKLDCDELNLFFQGNSEEKKIYFINLALKEQRDSLVEKMIDKGVNLIVKDYDGMTPLHIAIKNKNRVICRKILDEIDQESINQRDDRGLYPLHWAIFYDFFVSELMEKGAQIPITAASNTNDDIGKINKLQFACLLGNYDAVTKIVERYEATNMDLRDEILRPSNMSGATSLHFASMSGSLSVYKYLSEKVYPLLDKILFPLDSYGSTPLHYLCLRNPFRSKMELERSGIIPLNYFQDDLIAEDDELASLFDYIFTKDQIIANDDQILINVEVINNIINQNVLGIDDEEDELSNFILRNNMGGLNVFHYSAYYAQKAIFKKAIRVLELDIDQGNFSILNLINNLETFQEENSHISEKSVLSLSLMSSEKSIFNYIVKELPKDLGIDEIVEINNDEEERLLYFCDHDRDSIEFNRLKLYMMIIGCKVDQMEISIKKEKIQEFLNQIEGIEPGRGEKRDLYLILNNSFLGRLFLFNQEVEGVAGNELEQEINTLNLCIDNNQALNEDVNVRYVHSSIYTSDPIGAINILMRKLDAENVFNDQRTRLFSSFYEDKNFIEVVVENGLCSVVKLLIEKGISIIVDESTIESIVRIAIEKGYLEILDVIYNQIKIRVNRENKHYRLRDEDLGFQELRDFRNNLNLVNFGIDIFKCNFRYDSRSSFVEGSMSLKDSEGNNLLSSAIKSKSKVFFSEIIEKFDQEIIHQANNNGETPLHIALLNKRFNFGKKLLDKGAKPNIKDKKGYNPIFRMLEIISVEDDRESFTEIGAVLGDRNIDIEDYHKTWFLGSTELIHGTLGKSLYKSALSVFEREDIYSLIRRNYSIDKLLRDTVKSNDYDLVRLVLEKCRIERDNKPVIVDAAIHTEASPTRISIRGNYENSLLALLEFGQIRNALLIEFWIFFSVKINGSDEIAEKVTELIKYHAESNNPEVILEYVRNNFLHKRVRDLYPHFNGDTSLEGYLRNNLLVPIVRYYIYNNIFNLDEN